MLHSQYLSICLLLLLNSSIAFGHQAPDDGFYKREHSLVKPYAPSGGNMPFFELTGDTMVTNSFIRLTPDEKSRVGGIWNKVPCYQRAWEVHLTFRAHGASRNLAADGIAFWYINDKSMIGPVFGGPDQWKGLGIFLDTYKNGQSSGAFPRVSGIVNDGVKEFDHESDGETQSFGHCYAMLRNREHDTHLSLRYKEKRLTVKVNVDGSGTWRSCFDRVNVILPTGYYFGVTAATGDLTDNHDILGIRMYQLDTPDKQTPEWAQEEPRLEGDADDPRNKSANDEEGSSGKFWVLLLMAFGVAGVVGYFLFQKKRESQRQRFY